MNIIQNSTYKKIYELAANTKAINTHSHHLEDNFFTEFNLDKLLANTYINWTGSKFNKSKKSRENYINRVRFKSYFRWLQKALKSIYKINEDLSAKTWDYYSEIICNSHKEAGWHKKILKDYCNYEKVIIDAYWNPGSNNNNSDIFTCTFRIDPLFFGYSKDELDHDGNNVFKLYNKKFSNIDAYILFVRNLIKSKIRDGCVALKSAVAYDRDINYEKFSKTEAQKVFKDKSINRDNVKAFQDYVFYEICKIAAEFDIPIQCHTGLGCFNKTNALSMLNIIKINPETRFVLFHGGFPWSDDVIGLLHGSYGYIFHNVYADICWLPLLSPTAAESTINKLIEVSTAEKISWGCDTWTSEESYGARIAFNDLLANVLTKKIENGYFSINDAECIVENILYNNPKSLYNIKNIN
jgi:uncharacterized protein